MEFKMIKSLKYLIQNRKLISKSRIIIYSAIPCSILRSIPPSTKTPEELNTGLAIYLIIANDSPWIKEQHKNAN
ncbi:hypothetical protein QR98_0021380 [Sarcoptes scabiei]|uniref:Uncharacterized protein n=1 Tax=Sarcoptes scabiei TaxID=52283 RepID=A0A131ZYD4_SARSC|nr:hypothetical protein QR98_0021380 [Sarcoptes scabiei]